MNLPEQDDPVWTLLQHSKETEPGPYFTRRVMREVREVVETPSRGWFQNLIEVVSPRVAIPAFAAVAALALMLVSQGNEESTVSKTVSPGLVLHIGEGHVDPTDEMEAVEYLGQLMAVADPGQLSDEALADLFF